MYTSWVTKDFDEAANSASSDASTLSEALRSLLPCGRRLIDCSATDTDHSSAAAHSHDTYSQAAEACWLAIDRRSTSPWCWYQSSACCACVSTAMSATWSSCYSRWPDTRTATLQCVFLRGFQVHWMISISVRSIHIDANLSQDHHACWEQAC